MALRFRQSFTLFPGVRLNMGKHGISASFGVPGATVNVGARGVRATMGLPGSGLSYSADLMKFGGNAGGQNSPQYLHPDNAQYFIPQNEGMRQITSAGVEYLTSDSLIPLRDLIMAARDQRAEVLADLKEARELAAKLTAELNWKQWPLFRLIFKRRITALQLEIPATHAEVKRLQEWEGQTHINVNFDAGNFAKQTFETLAKSFANMAASARVWDITSDAAADRFVERTTATRTVERTPVKFDFAANDLLKFEGQAMRFGNANGDDILIYPGMALIPGRSGAFALIDLRELEVDGTATSFIETDGVPADSEIIGQTWYKANKDGSRDRRFNGNYQIPIVRYGRLTLTTSNGLNEEYQLSNAEAVAMFHTAMRQHKQALMQATTRSEQQQIAN